MRDVETFLADAGWAKADRAPLAGDMSPRRYTRLTGPAGTAILMDADDSQTAFVAMTGWLREHDLSAPRILHADAQNGLLLLEDLGDLPVKRVLLQEPGRARDLYLAAIDLLLTIRRAEPPDLPCPDAAELVGWTDLVRHYPGVDADALAPFLELLHSLLTDALAVGPTVSLRDFHADNLMWLPDRDGVRRFGLLDYQDAFLTHPCYDLVSLLTDARTEVPRELRERIIDAYLERSGDDPEPFRRAFVAFSAQRNVRILGLFARSGRRTDARARVHGYVREALDHPAFAPVRDETLAAIPEPSA